MRLKKKLTELILYIYKYIFGAGMKKKLTVSLPSRRKSNAGAYGMAEKAPNNNKNFVEMDE